MNDKHVVNALVSIGRCQEILKRIESNEVLDNLSKHNTYWHSEHESDSEKLHDIRCSLLSLTEDIAEIIYILSLNDEETE